MWQKEHHGNGPVKERLSVVPWTGVNTSDEDVPSAEINSLASAPVSIQIVYLEETNHPQR
jgi:hypothetical protein